MTVVIPVYNAGQTIEQCVNSVLNQSIRGIQLIIINDGSTDKTGRIIKRYENLQNVLIITQDNQGVSAARNRGIDEAIGKYITFVDSDDVLDSTALEKMYCFAEKHNLDLVACSHEETNATIYGGNRNDEPSFVAEGSAQIGTYFFKMFPQSACAKLYNLAHAKANGLYFPIEMQLSEDLYFTYSYLLTCKRIGKVDGVYYHIKNVNPESLSKKYVKNIENNLIKRAELWEQLIKDIPNIEDSFYEKNMDYHVCLVSEFANNLYKHDCPLTYSEKRKELQKFLSAHVSWLKDDGDSKKKPKNRFDKITYTILRIKNITFICALYSVKEYLKSKKLKKTNWGG